MKGWKWVRVSLLSFIGGILVLSGFGSLMSMMFGFRFPKALEMIPIVLIGVGFTLALIGVLAALPVKYSWGQKLEAAWRRRDSGEVMKILATHPEAIEKYKIMKKEDK